MQVDSALPDVGALGDVIDGDPPVSVAQQQFGGRIEDATLPLGVRPTIVERVAGQRSSGNPIDVRGPAVEVAERMGVMDRIRAASTTVTSMSFVNAAGRRVGRVNGLALRRAAGSREVELPRADLAAILLDASKDRTDILFGDTITALEQDSHGVDVTSQRAAPLRPRRWSRRAAFHGAPTRFRS